MLALSASGAAVELLTALSHRGERGPDRRPWCFPIPCVLGQLPAEVTLLIHVVHIAVHFGTLVLISQQSSSSLTGFL